MATPLPQVFSIGTFSEWGQEFLGDLQKRGIATIAPLANPKQLSSKPESFLSSVFFLENLPENKPWLQLLLLEFSPPKLVWIGRDFSQQDYECAVNGRVPLVLIDPDITDSKVVSRIEKLIRENSRAHHARSVIRAMKEQLIQLEGDVNEQLMGEFRKAIVELEETLTENPTTKLEEATQGHTRDHDSLMFHSQQSLSDVLETIDVLDRTGVLWVRHDGGEGSIEFIQGRVVNAETGSVSGEKAIFRMFVWDDPKCIFTRRDPNEFSVIHEHIRSVKTLIALGERYRELYAQIRNDAPPFGVKLQLVSSKIHPETSMPKEQFSALASVVEFETVGELLDFNPLPDALLLEALIQLRKQGFLKVLART